MKTTRVLFPCLSLGLLAIPAARAQDVATPDPPPGIPGAMVTIPYSELKALWDAAQPDPWPAPEPRPPLQAVLMAAHYELTFADQSARLSARYRMRSFTGDWQLVPLLGGEAQLAESTDEHAGIVWQNEGYHLLTQERGESEFQLHFTLGDPAAWPDGLRLIPGTAAMNRLHVSGIPAGKSIRIAGLSPTESRDGAIIYHIPGGLPELAVFLDAFREPEAAPPPEASTWNLQSEVCVRYRDGRLHYESRIHCQANGGSGLAMDLVLPGNALELSLEGEDFAESELGRRDDGSRTSRVKWQTRDVLDRVVLLTYAVPQSPLATSWLLSAPRVPEENATQSLLAIVPVEGLELAGEDLKDSVQSRRLSEWLGARIGTADFLTVETGASCELRTIWLPRLETAQAIVQLASYETRLFSDGALLVKARYNLTHQSPLAWRLELPAIEEILTCEVNGLNARPVKRGETTIEFALPAPDDGSSTVSLCYAARLEALDRVSGRCDLQLPRTSLFVHDLTWALALPDDYKTTAFEGNLTIDPRPASDRPASESVLCLRKQLLRGEHPTVELHYERRGLDD